MRGDISFDQIIDEFGEKVYNQAYRMLGSREDAEDAVQDVFLKVFKGLGEFRGDSQLSTWIWRITTNICITRRSKKTLFVASLDAETHHIPEVEVEERARPDAMYGTQETREQLAALIAELNPQEAAAITLFYIQDLPYGEIAKILNIPAGSVATALHRGRERLRALYEKKVR